MRSRYTILSMHLHDLMQVFGVTCEELGNAIGVTKQTISNLSTRKSRMSKEHYIAIRLYFDYLVDSLSEFDNNELKMHAYILAFGTTPLHEELPYIFNLKNKGETINLY